MSSRCAAIPFSRLGHSVRPKETQLTILAGIGRLAPTKASTTFVAVTPALRRLRKSVFPIETAVGMVHGTRRIQPGAAARRLCRFRMALVCSIASQRINFTEQLSLVTSDLTLGVQRISSGFENARAVHLTD